MTIAQRKEIEKERLYAELRKLDIEKFKLLKDVMNSVWNDQRLTREDLVLVGEMLVDGLEAFEIR
ncbi:MAG: hypothetical protein ACLQF0_06850 [Dissulfurispiraceae bacterium]